MTDDQDSPAPDVHALASALRADTADLNVYAGVLTTTLADALPAGIVEIERERSLADRLAGRPGTVISVRLHLGEHSLELVRTRSGQPAARDVVEVRGVVISRREITLAEFSHLLADHLSTLAAESTAARAALAALLGM